MFKNPWFTLALGLMGGLAIGYVLAEQQAVQPRTAQAVEGGAASEGLPAGHPPVDGGQSPAASRLPEARVQELLGLLSQSPDDARLMVQLGNLYYDAERWQEARMWYERARELEPSDPDLATDLAVVYRALGQPATSLELLDEVVESRPEHWQALYNKVVILHFDMHEHDRAEAVLSRLEALAETNQSIPDLSPLASEVRGSTG